MTIRAHRFVAAGALAVATVAAPIAVALSSGNAAETVAGPPCLAWFGNQEDGVCLSYSNGQGVNVGTPGPRPLRAGERHRQRPRWRRRHHHRTAPAGPDLDRADRLTPVGPGLRRRGMQHGRLGIDGSQIHQRRIG